MNKILKKIGDYLKERFSKEKISSYSGIGLVLLYLLGKISGQDLALISQVLEMFGFDMPAITDLVVGTAMVAAPTSKLKKRIKK